MHDIKTYLRNIYELESSVYQQTKLSDEIKNKLTQLPSMPSSPDTNYKWRFLIAAVIGGISYLIAHSIDYTGAMILLVILLWLGGLALLIGGGICFIIWLLSEKGEFETEARELSVYNNGQALKRTLEADLTAINSKLTATKSLLDSYYNKGLLHEKYRNLICVAYLLDSLETGRAYKLDGPDGAYQQLEIEIRLDRISLQLNNIAQKLDQIKQNQYSLYRAINEANSINSQISVKLDSVIQNLQHSSVDTESIKRSLNTANRNAELTRKEIAYRNYLDHGSQYTY